MTLFRSARAAHKVNGCRVGCYYCGLRKLNLRSAIRWFQLSPKKKPAQQPKENA
jgi:DNA repair photolyase